MKNCRANVYMDTREIAREDWLAARRNGIGGSDAAAIMGASQWASPLSVYVDKIGLAPEKETSEAMRQGTDFESYVADRFTEETGIRLRRMNRMLQHPKYPWMLADIDRDVVGEEAGFEAKTTSVYNKCDFEGGEVPLTYQWQCQHYMAVTGMPVWYLAVLVLGKAFHIFRIDRDEALISSLVAAEKDFWQQHVEKRIPPFPIGADSDDDAIAAIYPDGRDGASMDLFELENELDMLDLLKADKRLLEQRISENEEKIKLALGECESGASVRWKVFWKNSMRTVIDTKRLRAEMPDVAERYSTISNTRTFRVTKQKEA